MDSPTPTVTLTEGVYTFELTVRDNNGQSDIDQVVITVNGSSPTEPIADAGDNQMATADNNGVALVMLDGSGSTGSLLEFE